jgi:hypothetical protein
VESAEHVAGHGAGESRVLLVRQLAQPIEPESFDQRVDVDEVAGLRTTEQGEQLVGGELLDRQHRTERARFGGADAGVGGEIDLGRVVTGRDREPGETVALPLTPHRQAGRGERPDRGDQQAVDVFGGRSEEVEVAGGSIDDTGDDEGGATGEREPVRLR